jgi:TPR repeat protein
MSLMLTTIFGTAVKHLVKKELNYAAVQERFDLGVEYYFSKGIAQDYRKAFQYFKKATGGGGGCTKVQFRV